MIRIREIARENLNDLANWYFDQLNPKNQDETYNHWSLIKRIERAKEEDQNDIDRNRFWFKILDEDLNYNFLRKIITGNPEELEEVSVEIDNEFGLSFLSNKSNYDSAELSAFGARVKGIFNYETQFRAKEYCTQIVERLGIWFCPYCNENKTKVISITEQTIEEEKRIRLLDLDHFMPQVRFPYLSISFFNIIPSCHSCNSRFKSTKDFKLGTHIHPHIHNFDDFFCFRLNSDIIEDSSDINIEISEKEEGNFSRNSINDFKLEDRYNDEGVKEILFNLYNEIKTHPTGVVDEINAIFQAAGEQSATIQSILRASSVPFVQKDINKYAYGKLKRDICLNLKLIQ